MLNRWMQHCDTGGLSVALTADGDTPTLQFSTAATEQFQNYGRSLFRWHEPFVSSAWPVSAAESKLKEEKYFQCYSVINASSCFFLRSYKSGEVLGLREREMGTHTPSSPWQGSLSTPVSSPASQAGSITSSVDWGHPHCEWFKRFWNYRKNRKWL